MLALKLLFLHIACLTIALSTAERNSDFEFNWQANTARPIPTFPPDYTHHSDVKTAYKLHNDKLNWQSAAQSCRSEGARLAVIDTEIKLQYVIGMRSWLDFVWTGISRKSSEFNWKSVDESPLSADLPWSIVSYQMFGDCVAVHGLVHGLSSWSCGAEKKYVCEIPDTV